MSQSEFKVGDRVIVNGKYSAFHGCTGTIRFAAKGHYWLKFADSEKVVSGFHIWCLEPFGGQTYNEERLARFPLRE